MSKHLTPRRGLVGQDQKSRGCGSGPTEPFLGNPMGQTYLFVVPTERLLDRGQLGLDLDHDQRAGWPMEAENIDRPALAVDGIRDFDRRLPRVRAKCCHRFPNQLGVAFVQRAVEAAASPTDIEFAASVEGRDDAPDPAQRKAVEVAALEERYRGLGQVRRCSQVRLAPAASTAQRPDDQSDSLIVHVEIVAGAPYPSRTRQGADPPESNQTTSRTRLASPLVVDRLSWRALIPSGSPGPSTDRRLMRDTVRARPPGAGGLMNRCTRGNAGPSQED